MKKVSSASTVLSLLPTLITSCTLSLSLSLALAMNSTIGACEMLGGIRRTAVIGRYGGGDGMAMARVLLAHSLPLVSAPMHDLDRGVRLRERDGELAIEVSASFQSSVWHGVTAAHAAWKSVQPDRRVASLPEDLPAAGLEDFQPSASLVVSSIDLDLACGDHLNLFTHGWLLAEELEKAEACGEPRQGISRDVLAGFVGSDGLAPTRDAIASLPFTSNDRAASPDGIVELRTGDQHAHLVVEELDIDGFIVPLSDWHLGSDMLQVRSTAPLAIPRRHNQLIDRCATHDSTAPSVLSESSRFGSRGGGRSAHTSVAAGGVRGTRTR